MKKKFYGIFLASIIFQFLLIPSIHAQVFSNKEIIKKVEIDSSEIDVYPYRLPIWGEKATQAGFTLPYSAGLSVQYFGSRSDILIDNLKVGFNGGEMYELDGIVRFDKARATATSITARPDFWLFPFLNIYGILGTAQASTEVGFGVWAPDSTGRDQELFNAETIVEFRTTTFGFGFTPTIGVAGGFLALDMNFAWTDVPQLDKPAQTFVFGPRFGKMFKLKNPESNIAVWVGGFRVALSSNTSGSLDLSEVLPDDGDWEQKIENGIMKVDETQAQVDDWWNDLSDFEQRQPSNKARYEAANKVLAGASQILNAADNAIDNIQSSTVQYSMDKQIKDPWNFIMGAQYQINRHFMLRYEMGFLGSRNQIIAGVQYRFGL